MQTDSPVYVREATIRWSAPKRPQPRVSAPNAAAEYFRAALPIDDPREYFAVLALSTRHHVIGHHVVSIGTLDASLVHPREVFRFAALSSAAALILAHTHPSGDPSPSPDDVTLTRRLVSAGELMGISVLDHVVIAGESSVSLRTTQPALFTR